ncbi:MAG TPA: winged helix DNA-binding protein [Caulobacteraceae bacterium]|jgi:DNA-binding MarR family transcriptional regulator
MTPAQELRFLILAAQRAGNRIVSDKLKPLGLTPAQAEVVQVLGEFAPVSLARLGELLVCESGSPSRLVAGLVKRRLVDRSISPEDGRVVELSLSEEGRAALDQIRALDEIIAGHIVGSLTGGQVGAVVGALRKLLADTAPGQAVARRRSKV